MVSVTVTNDEILTWAEVVDRYKDVSVEYALNRYFDSMTRNKKLAVLTKEKSSSHRQKQEELAMASAKYKKIILSQELEIKDLKNTIKNLKGKPKATYRKGVYSSR